jgi:hypothetical protein
MFCCNDKSLSEKINPHPNAIRVEEITFYCSEEDGSLGEEVDGVFYTTGL